MTNNSQLEEIPHGCSTSSVFLAKEKGNKKNLCRKVIGSKIVICTQLCMTKYITYMHTYKTRLDQIVKLLSLLKMNEVNVTS